MPRLGLRDFVKTVSPTWLQAGSAELFLYTIGLELDGLLDKLSEGIAMRMPGYGDTTALPYVGNDRLIPQGLTETEAQYIGRLKAWLDSWQRAGSARAVMAQVLGYLSQIQPLIRTVSDSSCWDTYLSSDNFGPLGVGPSHFHASFNWNWDGEGDPHPVGKNAWWRWWLIIQSISPTAWTTNEGTWGDGALWGNITASWGLSVPASEITSIRNLVTLWKRAGSWCRWIIVSFDATLFDPTQAADSVHNPDGTFAHWSVVTGNEYVPARFANARYCDGTA